MKIKIEKTDEILSLDGVRVRVWRGITMDQGTPCVVFVHRIGVEHSQKQEEFNTQLSETPAPASYGWPAILLRLFFLIGTCLGFGSFRLGGLGFPL